MGDPVVAVITGANRGIGEAICQTLANSVQEPLIIYAASRKGVDFGIKMSSSNERHVIRYPKLDITDPKSIDSLAKVIKKDHSGVNVLINNAGVNLDTKYSPENVRNTLETNYHGTLQMCQTFIPLLKNNSRIVNMSSVGSSLNHYSDELKHRFRDPNMTLENLQDMVTEYQTCANNRTESQHGWPRQAYSVSKACINALTAVLARENPELIINACCPGWVSTDMGRMVGSPPKRPIDGAKIPLRLGFGDVGGISGRYWANPSIAGKGDGQVMEW